MRTVRACPLGPPPRGDRDAGEVVEAALAHKVRNQIEAAYRRTDLFERRRQLMEDWAAYLGGERRDPEAQRVG